MSFSDEKKVKKARKQERIDRAKELEDLRAVLKSPEGRRVMWRLLEFASVFGSIWTRDAGIHYNAGIQDFGHKIMADIDEADQEALFLMMREAKEIKNEQ